MPRVARITILRDKRNPRLPHMLNIPASLSATGERQRPHFATRAEAERVKVAEERRLHDYSKKSYGLTDAQKIEAAECYTRLESYPGKTLRDATLLASRAWDQERSSLPLAELGASFRKHAAADGLSDTYIEKSLGLLARLKASLPAGILVSGVQPVHIDNWLRDLCKDGGAEPISPVTRNNYRRHLSAAFGHAVGQSWCSKNPCELVKVVAIPDEPVTVLSPAKAGQLLRAAHPKIVAWFALGLFAGLRPTEAARLAWNDIGPKFIRIHASIAKTRRNRIVPVLDPLPQWLALAQRSRRGTVGHSDFYFRQAAEAVELRTPGKEDWPADCLRHSFGTYRATQISLTDLARDMGNSENIIVKHYREVTTPEAAAEFFSILP